MRRNGLLLVALFGLAGVGAIGPTLGAVTHDVSRELQEGSLVELGQKTCLAEGQSGEETTGCPMEEVVVGSYVFTGIRVLDSYVKGADPEDLLRIFGGSIALSGGVREPLPQSGTSADSPLDPLLPAAILPGPSTFVAWWGVWKNWDQDSVIYSNTSIDPPNEWVATPGFPSGSKVLVGYVEPGSHPGALRKTRPDEFTPDFSYRSSTPYWVSRVETEGPIVFLDGSLLQEYRVTTVSDPIFAPSEGRPYTPTERSLVDIDIYAALLGGPLSEIYSSSLAPLVNSIGSPGLSSYPLRGGRVEPSPSSDSPLSLGPLSDLYDTAVGLPWTPYPHETDPFSGSSNNNYTEDYAREPHSWIDLKIRFGVSASSQRVQIYTLKTSSRDNVAPPSHVFFEIWVGVFRDLNSDGWIGAVKNPTDPYEKGARPDPNDYENPRGEFFGAIPRNSTTGRPVTSFKVFLAPLPSWSEVGVLSGTTRITGSQSIVLTANPTIAGDLSSAGYYTTGFVTFPLGTAFERFRACTESLSVAFIGSLGPTVEPVKDCDTFG